MADVDPELRFNMSPEGVNVDNATAAGAEIETVFCSLRLQTAVVSMYLYCISESANMEGHKICIKKDQCF